jgi:hypothetical protein
MIVEEKDCRWQMADGRLKKSEIQNLKFEIGGSNYGE